MKQAKTDKAKQPITDKVKKPRKKRVTPKLNAVKIMLTDAQTQALVELADDWNTTQVGVFRIWADIMIKLGTAWIEILPYVPLIKEGIIKDGKYEADDMNELFKQMEYRAFALKRMEKKWYS